MFFVYSNLSTILKHDDWIFFFLTRECPRQDNRSCEVHVTFESGNNFKLYFLHLRLKYNIPHKSKEILRISRNYWKFWNEASDGISKLLWSPGIDSKESLPRAHGAWRAVWQPYSYLVPSPHRLFYRLHFITMKIIINQRHFLTKNTQINCPRLLHVC
jgi:hypothetical protein